MEEALLCILLLCCGAVSAQDWKNVGNCGAGLNCGPHCQWLCLSQHNYYRSLHGSPPLKCDRQLAKSAQSWANSNALHKTVQRSTPSKNYVESISWKKWGWNGMGNKQGAIPGAVRSWYSEIKRGYDYDTGEGNGVVTHFKNVIHARETRLGCGIAIKPGDGAYVVAHYSMGPMIQFRLNDFSPLKDIGPRKEPEPQCRLKSFEREQCGDLKGPFVTPDKCFGAGCCYDDIFMDEPELQWHQPKASIWCFKSKSSMAAVPPFGIAQVEDAVYGGDTSWMNVGSCGQGLTCNPDCQLLCLKLHNYYRAMHNSPPMKCDPELAKSAQKWTDQQAKDSKMYHSEWTDKFTESISWKGWGWEGMDKMEGAIPGAARSWYSEIKNNYDYATGKGKGVIGHFQAVVWKGETRLGCGLNIKPNDGTYVTAHYAPPSHTSMDKEKQAPDNVKPRKQPEPGCNIRSSQRVDCFGDSATEMQKAPYVTPELCIQKGCCYDDMFMSEPNVKFYSAEGRTWCFKKKGGAPGTSPTAAPTPGNRPSPTTAQPPTNLPASPTAQPPTEEPAPGGSPAPSAPQAPPPVSPAQQPQHPGSFPVQPQSPEAASALAHVIAVIDAVTRIVASKGSAQGSEGSCFHKSCYIFVTSGETWTKNQNTCKGKGGDLVSMETDEEWEYINSEIQQLLLPKENEWHIGLKNEGGWNWVSGNPLTIKKWQSGQPSGDGKFAVMSKDYPRGTQGLFNDLPDWIPRAFICEIPKGGATQPGVQPPMPAPPGTPTGNPTAPSGTAMPPTGNPTAPPGSPTTPPASPPPGGGVVSPASGQQAGMTGFEQDCLKAHNEYRAKHGVPPLKWNDQLKADAQRWANTLAQRNVIPPEHEEERNGAGENLAWFTMSIPTKQCQGPKTSGCTQCREMIKDWYDEIKDFDFSTGESKGGVITHFTQVVWKESKELGMATAKSADKFFTVARYKPRGNFGFPKDYIKNVPRPL